MGSRSKKTIISRLFLAWGSIALLNSCAFVPLELAETDGEAIAKYSYDYIYQMEEAVKGPTQYYCRYHRWPSSRVELDLHHFYNSDFAANIIRRGATLEMTMDPGRQNFLEKHEKQTDFEVYPLFLTVNKIDNQRLYLSGFFTRNNQKIYITGTADCPGAEIHLKTVNHPA